MCRYCEDELDTRYDPEYEAAGIVNRAYLSEYDSGNWELTISDGDNVLSTGVAHCPWCGRDLYI